MNVKQLGPNQTEVKLESGIVIFFSYETPVAVFKPGVGSFRTLKKWSVTTSKHLSKLGDHWAGPWHSVEQEEIEQMANE